MKKTRRLMTIKPHKYGTRHLTAGEEYEVPPRHAIALVATKKARFADKEKEKPARAAKPQVEERAIADDDVTVESSDQSPLDLPAPEAWLDEPSVVDPTTGAKSGRTKR